MRNPIGNEGLEARRCFWQKGVYVWNGERGASGEGGRCDLVVDLIQTPVLRGEGWGLRVGREGVASSFVVDIAIVFAKEHFPRDG